jgi:hypothetical protein
MVPPVHEPVHELTRRSVCDVMPPVETIRVSPEASLIDSTTETPISLAEAAKTVPRRCRGRKTHLSTIDRWATVGVRGIVLETLQCGGSRCTSREALQRFFERLSGPDPTGPGGSHADPAPTRWTAAQHQRDSAKAGRKLAELGA